MLIPASLDEMHTFALRVVAPLLAHKSYSTPPTHIHVVLDLSAIGLPYCLADTSGGYGKMPSLGCFWWSSKPCQ